MLIIGLLLATAAIAYALYYFFLKPKVQPGIIIPGITTGTPGQLPSSGVQGPTTTVPGGPGGPGGLPSAGNIPGQGPSYYQAEPVTKLNTDYAVYPSANGNGDLRYYNAGTGKFYRLTADGTLQEMSGQVFFNVSNVTWAKNKDTAVLEYPDGSNIIYNFSLQKQVTLPQHWQDFSFSPEGTQIAAKSIGLSPENRWLVTVNDDGSGTQILEPLGTNADQVTIDWSPSRQVVGFSQTGDPAGGERSEVLFVGLNHENFKSTIVEGQDFRPLWSPTGKKLVYSVYSSRTDLKPELWVVNAYGDKIGSGRQELNIITWANKCLFADDNILYCAVPRDLPSAAGLSPEIAADAIDDLYKIDLQTGFKTPITLGGDYTIQNLNLDTVKQKLYFTDSRQNGIFEVNI